MREVTVWVLMGWPGDFLFSFWVLGNFAWNILAMALSKGKQRTISNACDERRISWRKWGDPSVRPSDNLWKLLRSFLDINLWRTFFVTAFVYVKERNPCCWWEPSRSFVVVCSRKRKSQYTFYFLKNLFESRKSSQLVI